MHIQVLVKSDGDFFLRTSFRIDFYVRRGLRISDSSELKLFPVLKKHLLAGSRIAVGFYALDLKYNLLIHPQHVEIN